MKLQTLRKPLWVALPLVIGVALYFPSQLQASTTQKARLRAETLNGLIPLIEPDRVIAFRGGSWCDALAVDVSSPQKNRPSRFANKLNPSCINPLAPASEAKIAPDRVAKFTPEAQAVHQSILAFAKEQGFDDLSFEQAKYDADGQLLRAQFRVVVGIKPEFYVYEPGYRIVKPTWKPGYRQPLTADWYKIRGRWN
jgi:hypothetical protein